MGDIAKLANVATSTVSRALQGDPRVKAETRDRILHIAKRQGYAVNANARKLRQKRSNSIAVVMHLPARASSQWSGPFVFQLLADVAMGLRLRHQDLLLCSPESEHPIAYKDMLASKGVDGIIFLGQGPGDEWLRDVANSNAPVVVWGAADPDGRYCTVGSNNLRGGLLVGQHFAKLKRNKSLFIGNLAHPEMALRYEGLKKGFERTSGPAKVEYLEVADFSFETALQAVSDFLDSSATEMPDAIFAASDAIAMAALTCMQVRGINVPEQVSLVGYDDMPAAALVKPALTTVRQDTREAANLLLEKLFQALDGGRPKSAMLPTELIVRET